MGKIAARIALLFILTLPACSIGGGAASPAPDAARRASLDLGVAALEAADFRAAVERLAPIAAVCPTDALGRRAMLLLAAAELDPRNAEGRADAAAELAAFQLARAPRGEWEGTLATQLYLLALDHGAEPIEGSTVPDASIVWSRFLPADTIDEHPLGVAADTGAIVASRLVGADSTPAVAPAEPPAGGPRCTVAPVRNDLVMPRLTRPSLASQAAAPRAAAASGDNADSRALAAEVERLRAELARKEQELDRIRRTLRP